MLLNEADKVFLGAVQADAVYLGATKVWPPEEWGPEESIYAPGAVAEFEPNDPGTFMSGNRIRILADGRITALRYWRGATSLASRYVALWGDDGSVLADGTSSGDIPGWNLLPIGPVTVVAGQVVRAAIGYKGNAIDGTYPYTGILPPGSAHLRYESGAYTTPQLSGAETVFPANTIKPNNYYADIVYQPAPSSSPMPWLPTNLAGLSIWLDASQLGLADGATIGTWPNLGSATQPVLSPTPVPTMHRNAKNGLPCAVFRKSEGRLRITGTGVAKDWTLVYVAHMWGPNMTGRIACANYPEGGNLLIGWWNGFMDVAYTTGGGGFYLPDTRITVNTDWRLYSGDSATPEITPRMFSNGVLLGTHPTPPAADGWGGSFCLSGYDLTLDNESCDCEVAEVLLYNRKLSDAERIQAEAYLRTKWGPF